MLIDSLERRCLLSIVSINGTPGNDAIELTLAGRTTGGVDVRVRNAGAAPITVTVDRTSVQIAAGKTLRSLQIKNSGVVAVTIVDLGAGDDRFTADAALTIPMTLSGGRGNDTVAGGSGADLISGGDNADSLLGNLSGDTIAGDFGTDTLDGGSEDDQLWAGTLQSDAMSAAATDAGADQIYGGPGEDLLIGDGARGGSARLFGGDGDDVLRAARNGAAIDARGETGLDVLEGSLHHDTLRGGSGDDRFITHGGSDRLAGDAGSDIADFSARRDSLKVKDWRYGDDSSYYDPSTNTVDQLFATVGGEPVPIDVENIVLGSGNDDVDALGFFEYGSFGSADPLPISAPYSIHSGGGDDKVVFMRSPDFYNRIGVRIALYTDDGNDTVEFYGGGASVYGGEGNDTLSVDDDSTLNSPLTGTEDQGGGTSFFDGGPGTDVLAPDVNMSLYLDLRLNPGVEYASVYSGTLIGSEGPDHLTVSEGYIDGRGGEDTLSGGFGETTLIGGTGDDVLFTGGTVQADGNEGDDTFVNQSGVTDTIDGGDGFDRVQDDDTDRDAPGLQNDVFSNVEFVYDSLGEDAASASLRPASASALASATTLVAVVASGVVVDAQGVLRIAGTGAADKIFLAQAGQSVTIGVNGVVTTKAASSFKSITVEAGAGNDLVQLSSAKGKDVMQVGVRVSGGDGDDTILGGTGDDKLAGELGSDNISGGGGSNIVSGDFIVLKGEAVPKAALLPDGNDTLAGGSGVSDIVTYTYRTTPVIIDLVAGTAIGGKKETDRISGLEYIVGGQVSDILRGGRGTDSLFAGPGNDSLTGGAGGDILAGGFGSDLLDPDDGSDFLDTGAGDGVRDTVVGSLGKNYDDYPLNARGQRIDGTFDAQDYFSLSKRFHGTNA